MDTKQKMSVSPKPSEPKRRSDRIQKRKGDGMKKNAPKIVQRDIAKPAPIQPLVQQLKADALEKPGNGHGCSTNGKKRRKRKPIVYEIDCSGVMMDILDFQRELWNRAKNGKFNLAKKIRIKRNGNKIQIRSNSYVSKKCVRSNVHFLTTIYLKKKKFDRAVHVVGNGNQYKLMYK